MERNKSTQDPFQGGSIPKQIAKFAIPTILSQMVTLVYNLADTFFVGHTNDPSQVAALTLSFPVFMVLTLLGNLFGVGANSYISRSLGQGDRELAKRTSGFSFYGGLVGVLVVSGLLWLLMDLLVYTIGARTAETFQATSDYLMWTVVYGGLPTALGLVLAHLIRAEGNTRQASIGMALGGILNIFFDFVFVQLLNMGAEGAAIATCISNVVSFLYLLWVALKNKNSVIDLNFTHVNPNGTIVREVLLVGLPAAAMILLTSSVNLVMSYFFSGFGDVALAAIGISQKVNSVLMQVTIGLTLGIMPLLGYSYGTGDMKQVRSICKYSFLILACLALVCVGLMELFPRQVITLFTNEAATVAKGEVYLRIWVLCATGMCFTNLFNSIFQAMGKWVHSLVLAVVRQLVLLLPALVLMNTFVGELGLVAAQPITDNLSALLGLLLYLYLVRKEDR